MTATAADLIDEVVAKVAVRQFVATVSCWLRVKMAWDSRLFSEVHTVFTEGVGAWSRKRARPGL